MRTIMTLALLLSPSLANAQMACTEARETRKVLAEKYSEQRAFYGVSAMGTLIEIWVNPNNGSYTAIRIFPDGRACLMDAGNGATTVAVALGVQS